MVNFLSFGNRRFSFQFHLTKTCHGDVIRTNEILKRLFLVMPVCILNKYWVSKQLIQFNDYFVRLEIPGLRVLSASATQSNNLCNFVRYFCIFISELFLPFHCSISFNFQFVGTFLPSSWHAYQWWVDPNLGSIHKFPHQVTVSPSHLFCFFMYAVVYLCQSSIRPTTDFLFKNVTFWIWITPIL